uniref:Uncharacterized protein n=1 Tax=Fagus sylvatica TaxID=28930 RepID=A0A2N9GA16_FAGSY
MAMSKQEMVMITNLNQDGEVVCTKTETEKVVKSELAAGFNKPKPASVIPAKRKLVKTMMFEYLANFICSCFEKKGKAIYPHTA